MTFSSKLAKLGWTLDEYNAAEAAEAERYCVSAASQTVSSNVCGDVDNDPEPEVM